MIVSGLAIVSSVIALGCVAASIKRLIYAVTPTALDPALLLQALRGDAGRARFAALKNALEKVPEADWERDLVFALGRPKEECAALVNEQLSELDFRVERWSSVPRVCASIATSSGFLLASLALRNGLSVAGDLPQELRDLAVHSAVLDAINVISIGVAGAIFCAATLIRARAATKARRVATDKLVERLEALAG